MLKFRDFLKLYNFRYAKDINDYDTDVIRIFYTNSNLDSDEYIEFGIYDWGSNADTLKIAEVYLSPCIMNSYVFSISYDYDKEILCVYLSDSED